MVAKLGTEGSEEGTPLRRGRAQKGQAGGKGEFYLMMNLPSTGRAEIKHQLTATHGILH